MTSILAAHYRAACYLDVESFKPGNVSVVAPGHGMCAADFMRSADHSAAALTLVDDPLGRRIYAAVAATRAAVGCNTNLGIVLLVAPMVQATFGFASMPLRTGLTRVLDATTPADAAAVYAAIRLASPGGLGRAGRQDVADDPDVTLVEAMRLAAERDLIARQYANGFDELCNVAVPYLDDAQARFDDSALAMTDLYLYLLARFPDSHVARKHGVACAASVRDRAGDIHADFLAASDELARLGVLHQYDAELKQRGINPGTTADLCVAACFFHRLQQQAETHAGSAPDHARTAKQKLTSVRIVRLAKQSKENLNGSHYQDPRG